MAERMTVVIAPVGQENLTVEDAMRQVLEIFELLDESAEKGRDVEWRLVEAKTNSPPFSVTAEARPVVPGVEIDSIAREQKQKFARSLRQIKEGQVPDQWADFESQRKVMSLLERVAHGVKTQIVVTPSEPPLELTEADAIVGQKVMYALPELSGGKSKEQIGSIEGVLVNVTTYYRQPAIIVAERKSGVNVTCVLSSELAAQIAHTQTFEDVWKHRRVVVRGLLKYGRFGEIRTVMATGIAPVGTREITVDQIRDSSFTDGLPAADYLRKLRDGELE